MSLILAAALAMQPAAPLPIVQAFDTVCAGTSTIAAASERALASDWVEETPSRESLMGELIAMTRAAGSPAGDRVFGRTIDGRTLHLWVRETIPAPRGQFVECGIYDFAPIEPDRTLDAIIASRGRAPTDVIGPLADGTRQAGWMSPRGPNIVAGLDRGCRTRTDCSARIALYQSVLKED